MRMPAEAETAADTGSSSASSPLGHNVATEEHGLPTPRRYIAIAAVLAAIVLVVLDVAIANVALPAIAADLNVSPADVGLGRQHLSDRPGDGLLPLAALGRSWGIAASFSWPVALFTAASVVGAVAVLAAVARRRPLPSGSRGRGDHAARPRAAALRLSARLHGTAFSMERAVVALSPTAGPTVAAAILSWRLGPGCSPSTCRWASPRCSSRRGHCRISKARAAGWT